MILTLLSVPDDIDLKLEFQPDGYWCATDRNTYDAEFDSTGVLSAGPAGYGKTEAEAVKDLLDRMED